MKFKFWNSPETGEPEMAMIPGKWEGLFRRKCMEVYVEGDTPRLNGHEARERIAEEFEIMEKECSALREQVRHLEQRIYGSCGQ